MNVDPALSECDERECVLTGVAYEIPAELQRLARIVARAFYDPVNVAVIDVLVRERCVRVADLSGLFLLEPRVVRDLPAQALT